MLKKKTIRNNAATFMRATHKWWHFVKSPQKSLLMNYVEIGGKSTCAWGNDSRNVKEELDKT